MNPASHLLVSWSIANTCTSCRRDRAMVTIAGVIPDFDGAGIIADFLTSWQYPSIYIKYHHILGHNIGFGLLLCLTAFLLSRRRIITTLLVFLSFHIHLLADLAGSMGPDGYQWPIPYLLPFSDAWPNFAITFAACLIMFYIAWKRGITPLEIFSEKANNAFVSVLRNRFGEPKK